MSITDKSAEADFFVAFSRQYKLSTTKLAYVRKKEMFGVLRTLLD